MPSFKEFEKQVIRVLRKKEIDKLVFDLRFNGGGHSRQGTEFIRKICRSLPENKGEVFVLIGRSTREAAIINAVDFMKSTRVILVGEETSGTANHFGDVKRFVLPESRLIISHPSTYYSLLEEDRPSMEPDLHTPMDFKQYMSGTDPALEAVRRYKQP
ncbi:MAG: S41 family peptidase [Bacteroidales bacterium]|nr:S41 family peptidase [Bacteroidales bacterium]